MATSKKIYITQDTEFADGVTITQNGKTIGGGGLPIEIVSTLDYVGNKGASEKSLLWFYNQHPDTTFYFEVEKASATGQKPCLGILSINKNNKNTYLITGFIRTGVASGSNSAIGGAKSIYKTSLTETDLAGLYLANLAGIQDYYGEYGKNLMPVFAPTYDPRVTDDAYTSDTLAIGQLATKQGDDPMYMVKPSTLAFKGTCYHEVLGREGQWITPQIVYRDIEKIWAQVDLDYELKHKNITFELNFDEIINFVVTNSTNLEFYGYIWSNEHSQWVDFTGYTTYDPNYPEFDLVFEVKNENIYDRNTVFTYDISSGEFVSRNDKYNLFKINTTNGNIVEKASQISGVPTSNIKFYTQIITNVNYVEMNSLHEFDITDLLSQVPSGTTLYRHDLTGSINGSYNSGDVDIISGYILSTNSEPLSDIDSLYAMLGPSGNCISIKLYIYNYTNYEEGMIDRIVPATNMCFLTLMGGNSSAWPTQIQLELPTCSLIDTVTEL